MNRGTRDLLRRQNICIRQSANKQMTNKQGDLASLGSSAQASACNLAGGYTGTALH